MPWAKKLIECTSVFSVIHCIELTAYEIGKHMAKRKKRTTVTDASGKDPVLHRGNLCGSVKNMKWNLSPESKFKKYFKRLISFSSENLIKLQHLFE